MRSQLSEDNVLVSCPICGTLKNDVLFHDYNRRGIINCSGTYVKCKGCSLIYLRERASWKQICHLYSTANSSSVNPEYESAEKIKMRLQRPVPKWKYFLRKVRFRPHSWPLLTVPFGSKRLLDIGCGNGAKLFEFENQGYEVWGVDVSSDAIRSCQELLPHGHFVEGELHNIKLQNAYFDYIRMDNTLEHIPNPGEVIHECHRLLKKGGQLLIHVPHGRSFTIRFMKGDSVSSWIPFHLQLFTRKSLYRLLYEEGFRNIHIYGYYPNSWIPLSIMQLISRKKKMTKLKAAPWLNVVCYPFGWFFSKIGLGEELIGVCYRE